MNDDEDKIPVQTSMTPEGRRAAAWLALFMLALIVLLLLLLL